VNVRPKFVRSVTLFFVLGLVILALVYFDPHINLPQRTTLGCPILARLRPLSKAPVVATDFLEYTLYGGSDLVPYTVRIYGDGRVERDTLVPSFAPTHFPPTGCPLHDADKHFRIPAAQANALISKARDGGFCRLCQLYQQAKSTHDGDFVGLTMSFHGKTNSVSNISGNPPPVFAELVGPFKAFSSLPDYATTHHPTRERMRECIAFERSEFGVWKKQMEKH
jgi:hypothetical protein